MPTMDVSRPSAKTLYGKHLFRLYLSALHLGECLTRPLFGTSRENAPFECPLLTRERGIRFSIYLKVPPAVTSDRWRTDQPVLNPAA